jgi:hypothetical protein
MKRAIVFADPRPLKKRDFKIPQNVKMILNVKADIKQILKLGKKFKWQKPEKCDHCNETTLWGHGFVISFFDGFEQELYLKRYRCPYCHTVFKLKPLGYFKKFQADARTIFSSILKRVYKGRYLPGISWSRQHFWFTALKRNINAYLSNTWEKGIFAGFRELVRMNKIPVTSSI